MARLSETIGEIYDAATAPDGVAQLAGLLKLAGDGGSSMLAVLGGEGDMEAATSSLPDEALIRYAEHFHSVNPFYAAALARGPKVAVLSSMDMVPETAYRRTEFYCDFTRGLDTYQFLGGLLPIAPGRVAEFGVHRGERDGRYDEKDCHRLNELLPHVQRALQLRLRISGPQTPNLGYAALDALAIGVVVVSPRGRILFANAAAEALASDGPLRLNGGVDRVGAVRREDAAKIARLLADVASGGSGGAATISGPEGGRLFLLVAPLPPRFGAEPGHALVTVRPENAAPTIDADGLRRLFGLSPSEARLALALAAGGSLAELQAARGVSMNTIRAQLAATLRKTETNSQRGLVRLINLAPPVLPPRSG